ncbi:MAG TPA: cytochrome c oxidase subunit II [Rhizomicrobium sp.]|nr:cytochrome c oxidase subunit II [Rhizomicrobium sp.]
MFLKNKSAKLLGAVAFAGALFASHAALALPVEWQTDMQASASPVMDRIEDFHRLLLIIITLITIFVAILLGWVMIRFRAGANPVPSKTHHNTLLEVAWTLIPVLILVVIAIPSFRLLYFEADMPHPDVVIKAIGKQWFWTYEYKGPNFTFDSQGLTTVEAADGDQPDAAVKAGKPRLFSVDHAIYVPVNKVVEVQTTGADVIHAWTIPQFGVKIDAIPGKINSTWFKATQIGVFYGQCSELCGARHAFMPIEVHVVSDADYAAWLAAAKKDTQTYQPLADAAVTTTRLASKD